MGQRIFACEDIFLRLHRGINMHRKFRVLSTSKIDPLGSEMLAPLCELIVPPDDRADTLRRYMADIDALIVRVRLPDDIFTKAARLKAIVRHGVGLDFIPVSQATEAGIPVANLPDSNTQAVVEHVVGALFALARDFHRIPGLLKREGWSVRQAYHGLELRGRAVGIVGLGRIGLGVATALHHGFGMRVLGYDVATQATLPDFIVQTSLESVFSESDFITLHAPLLPSTQHLVNAQLLGLVKPQAYLINAARGGLVDDSALLEALSENRLAGAALDVFEPEPLAADHPYLQRDNVLVTPHTAALTQESVARMSVGSAQAVLDVLHGRCPTNLVNPEIWDHYLERWNLRSPR
ncbi:hydroxyacid dehydrogenase [Paraburkholderia phenazinium]